MLSVWNGVETFAGGNFKRNKKIDLSKFSDEEKNMIDNALRDAA